MARHSSSLFQKVIQVNLIGSFNMIRLDLKPCAKTPQSPLASVA